MIQTLVTGGTGFVGSSIVQALVDQKQTVLVLTRDPLSVPRERRVAGAHYIEGDVFEAKSLGVAMAGCDAVVNAVQFENAPFEDPKRGRTYERVDGEGTEHQVAAAKEAGVQRFLYLSGAGTREGREEPWFRAKNRAEKAVRESGMNWTIFRPSWIFGPEDQSLNKFALFARISPVVPIIGTGREVVQPVFVEDVARIVAQCLNLEASFGKTLEIGGDPKTMREIVETLLRVQQKRRWILPQPKPLMKVIASFLQRLPSKPLTVDGIDFVTMEESVDPTELRKVLPSVHLRSLEQGLSTYL